MDSIGLRLHFEKDNLGNYGRNHDLVEALIFTSQANKSLLKNEVDFMTHSIPIMANELTLLPTEYIMKQFHWLDNDKKVDYIKGRFHIPSSHYDVGYRVDMDREFVDISFSIPKYIYGHSVAQFVRNPHLENPNQGGYDRWKDVTSHWYTMLVEVIRDFFHNTFTGIEVCYEDIELVRIDLAFNQYFRTKEEAVRVSNLMSQKRSKELRGKRGRNEYRHDEHSSGFVAIQKNVYYKCYHKGTEFATVGDSKRLLRHNKKKLNHVDKTNSELVNSYGEVISRFEFEQMKDSLTQLDPDSNEYWDVLNAIKDFRSMKTLRKAGGKKTNLYDVDELQKEADLIMRHEVRFVPKSMSYFWKNHLYRKDCQDWQGKKARFKELEAKRVKAIRNTKAKGLSKEEREEHSDLSRRITKRHRFFLRVPNEVKNHCKEVQYGEKEAGIDETFYPNHHFSRELFYYLVDKFQKIIESVQVDELPTWETLKIRLDSYNADQDTWNQALPKDSELRTKKISLSVIRSAYERISQYDSLDTAYEEGCYSKATYYRVREQLKKLGFGTTMSHEPIYVDTSFATYFERMRGVGCAKPMYPVYFSNMKTRYRKLF